MANGVVRVESHPDPNKPGIDNYVTKNSDGADVYRQRIVSHSPLEESISDGKVWLGGVKKTVSLTIPEAVAVVYNPPSSTKVVKIFHFNVTGSVPGDVQFFHTHSDLSAFGDAITLMNPNHYYDAATPAVKLRASTVLPDASDIRSPIRRVSTQEAVEFDGLIILPPGHAFGVRVSSAPDAGAYYINVRLIEG